VENNQALTKQSPEMAAIISSVILTGDLSRLTQAQKFTYYCGYCERLGLDPATKPFLILNLQGKEVLYCDRSGSAQLTKKHKVSHTIIERKAEGDIYSVVARASADGRQTESIGAVSILGLKGDALANAYMKCETKAKRRATLDLLGLGMLDETEIETIPGIKKFITPQELGDGASDTAVNCDRVVDATVSYICGNSVGDIPADAPEEGGNLPFENDGTKLPLVLISEPQRKRMFAISNKAGKTEEQLKAIVKKYGFEHSRDITRDKYELICNEVEGKREPGQD
jgi:hypothetical protein